MFGYVMANSQELRPEQRKRYLGCYCGICRQKSRDPAAVWFIPWPPGLGGRMRPPCMQRI